MQTLTEDRGMESTPKKSIKQAETEQIEEARIQSEQKEIENLMEEFKKLKKKDSK